MGMTMLNMILLCQRLNCSVLYEAQTFGDEGTYAWIYDFQKALIEDPYDLNIRAIDARFSALGYKGMQYLKGQKNVSYLNAANAPFFNDHCMARLGLITYLIFNYTEKVLNLYKDSI